MYVSKEKKWFPVPDRSLTRHVVEGVSSMIICTELNTFQIFLVLV